MDERDLVPPYSPGRQEMLRNAAQAMAATAEDECPHCTPRTEVIDAGNGRTVIGIEHQEGCPNRVDE